MKILFLTNKPPFPPKDGGSIATMAMIRSFAESGNEITVLAMNTRKHHVTPFEIPGDIQRNTIIHLVEVPAPITVYGALLNFLFSRLPYNAERFINTRYQKKLELLLSANSYDIIQLEGLYLVPYIQVIRKLCKSVIVYRSHNIEYEIWERTVKNSKWYKKDYLKNLAKRIEKFEKDAINQYDKCDEQKLVAMGNSKPSLAIPTGIDTLNLKPFNPGFNMNLFYIGALDWIPNQEGLRWFIVNSFPQVIAKFPDIELKIAGRNAPLWFIKELSHPNITFLGEIEDASEFYSQNGIMIVPLLSGSGMRIKIVEGMSYSKSIVTTKVGCEGIDAENGKHIFITDDPGEFSKYIITLLNDRNLIASTGERASAFIQQHYDNKELNRRLTGFYNQYIK